MTQTTNAAELSLREQIDKSPDAVPVPASLVPHLSEAAILLDIPFMGADVGQEPFALGIVRDDAAVGKGGVVMKKNLADIENDMPYFRGHE